MLGNAGGGYSRKGRLSTLNPLKREGRRYPEGKGEPRGVHANFCPRPRTMGRKGRERPGEGAGTHKTKKKETANGGE